MSEQQHQVHIYDSRWRTGARSVVCELCGKRPGDPMNRWVDRFGMGLPDGKLYVWCSPDHPRVILAEVHSS